MTKLGIAKLVIQVVSTVGVSAVTSNVIVNNVNIDSTEDKIKVAVGTIVISSMVVEAASGHVNQQIDAIASIWQNRKSIKPAVMENLNQSAA